MKRDTSEATDEINVRGLAPTVCQTPSLLTVHDDEVNNTEALPTEQEYELLVERSLAQPRTLTSRGRCLYHGSLLRMTTVKCRIKHSSFAIRHLTVVRPGP